jgi:hypothetical protein
LLCYTTLAIHKKKMYPPMGLYQLIALVRLYKSDDMGRNREGRFEAA